MDAVQNTCDADVQCNVFDMGCIYQEGLTSSASAALAWNCGGSSDADPYKNLVFMMVSRYQN
jgi:hypothetical protein